MSDDEQRAAEALAALQAIDTDQIQYKAVADGTPAVLDVSDRDVTMLFSLDSLDRVNDITEVGAFKKSTSERIDRIAHLYFHDTKAPAIARIMAFQALKRAELPQDVQQEYPDATGGMACTSRYLSNGRAGEVLEGIKAGIAYQASFGYQVVKAEQKALPDGRRARVIKELKLYEVSTVPPGMAIHPGTRALRVQKALDELLELKAGWRHGRHDDLEKLTQIHEIVSYLLGLTTEPRDAEPSAYAALTSEVDDLLAKLDSMSEVTT